MLKPEFFFYILEKNLSLDVDKSKMNIHVSYTKHYISCLGSNLNSNNEKIYFFKMEYDINMNIS